MWVFLLSGIAMRSETVFMFFSSTPYFHKVTVRKNGLHPFTNCAYYGDAS